MDNPAVCPAGQGEKASRCLIHRQSVQDIKERSYGTASHLPKLDTH